MWQISKTALQIVVIPLTLAAIGFFIQQALQESQLRAERLKLSVGILADPTSKQPLRTLAVKLLDHSMPSEAPLDEQLRLSLETGATNFPPDYKGWGVIRSAVGAARLEASGSALGEAVQAAPNSQAK